MVKQIFQVTVCVLIQFSSRFKRECYIKTNFTKD